MKGPSIQRTLTAVHRRIRSPKISVRSVNNTTRSGSDYGGWTYLDLPGLKQGTALSLGLGEDASFDVELASRYDAQVYIYDPTPRAIKHFAYITERIGEPSVLPYSRSGQQDPSSYDLRAISRGQLHLVTQAVSSFSGEAEFFEPRDPSHVSHSLGNIQHSGSRSTPSIRVPVIDICAVFEKLQPIIPKLLKMDIEGAEMQVIPRMLTSGLLPDQVLVEFDLLNFPSRQSTRDFYAIHAQMQEATYVPFHWDGRSCISYALKEAL